MEDFIKTSVIIKSNSYNAESQEDVDRYNDLIKTYTNIALHKPVEKPKTTEELQEELEKKKELFKPVTVIIGDEEYGDFNNMDLKSLIKNG